MSWLISATGIARTERDAQTQSQFEDVEVKPQALDWLFCVAAGYPFNVSCDNLEATSNRTAWCFNGEYMRR